MLDHLRARGREGQYIASPDDIVSDLAPRLKGAEVLVIMSNGSFGGIHEKMLTALRSAETSAHAEG
jgi:UDP-N-acetylmuramate-alanine ligase